ncbi:Gfo/Idh/MocA family protein [Desertibacillus haloalkaliphilus]|uniref:Gfo/Idh/MocA family protein n=1 Tax=Desertibacillus haloalkaliphilus TaxID=1328930 RepID=UPI001C26C86A|nr:Gfo/Idh/MocA family oxidoreductase [Desertibacillus haloalkaliphilus]MBU8908907.1 Gfo/Idh/MocA family oxidoreductase [Desertibacillus haloalkaliphilus]
MIRFGVIGTNWITEKFIQAATEVEGFTLSAVYSRTDEQAKRFAAKFSVEATFTDLKSFVESDEIDAVYIASPNSFHAEQAILCMEHGKHVLCEKPMASNSKEVNDMIYTAKQNNVLLMEALKTTLLPNFKTIQENINRIGKIRRYVASYCQYSSRYDAYKEGKILNAFNPAFSNGSLMDIGVYCVYPLVVLFGKPDTVKANGIVLESGVDGEGSMTLKYSEKDAVISYSKITNSSLPSEIQGEKGNIIIDKIHTPEKVDIKFNDGSVEDITREQEKPSMYYEVKEFIDLIKNGELESQVNTYKNSLVASEIIEDARKQMGIVYPADR